MPPPCVILEGLDGVGKSTTIAKLKERLGAVQLRTPPDEIRPYRAYFDANPTTLRQGYYELGNFIAGAQMKKAVEEDGKPVVCDRFYASTKAYSLAYDTTLPPPDSPLYQWPETLYRPSHMILLSLPEPTRLARREGRTTEAETVEEAKLRTEPDFAERVMENFRRLGCVEVSAEGTTEEVVERILAVIKKSK